MTNTNDLIVPDVPYETGGVVSRTVLKNKGGNVTYFSFDKGQELSEHSAPFDAIAHVFDGRAEITVGGTPHVVNTSASILMPANIPHALKAIERFKMMLVMLKE